MRNIDWKRKYFPVYDSACLLWQDVKAGSKLKDSASPPLTWTRVERTEPYTLTAWHLTRLSCRSLRHLSGEKGWKWSDPLARLETIPG